MKSDKAGLMENKLIMDVALRGSENSWGAISANWKKIGHYLIAYIKDYNTSDEYFRVFRVASNEGFDRKLVLNPSYIAEEYLCIYDSKESTKGRVVLHSTEELWMDYVRGEMV